MAVLTGAGSWANGLARHSLILHYSEYMVGIAKSSSLATGAPNGARAAAATLTREPAPNVPAHGGRLVNRLVHADEAAAIGVEEADLGMPTGLVYPVNLKAGRAKLADGVSKRRAH